MSHGYIMKVNGPGTEPWRTKHAVRSLLFDVFAAGDRVPHAGAGQDVHVIHNDKGLLLQSHDGEVVLIGFLVSV